MDKYNKIYDFVNIVKVACTFVAVLYVVYWFLCLINIPYLEYIKLIFAPPVELIKAFIIKIDVPYAGISVDMVPLIVSLFFAGFYFVLQYLSNFIEEKEKQHKMQVIEEKKLEEKLVNENLKKIFLAKTMEYTKFAILLSLEFKCTVDPNIVSHKENMKELATKNYTNIVNAMRKKYAACKAVTPGKLFIVYNNFALFDDFFTDLLKEIKKIGEINSEKNLNTGFTIAIDAVKESDKIAHVFDLLEKIASFNYTNRAIATPSFNVRYKLDSDGKYSLESMGISRFYEKNADNTQTGIDFELFALKTKNKKF